MQFLYPLVLFRAARCWAVYPSMHWTRARGTPRMGHVFKSDKPEAES